MRVGSYTRSKFELKVTISRGILTAMTARQNIGVLAARSIFIDLIGDALYFPLWWYSSGLQQILLGFARSVTETADHLSLRLLILNIFRPMFAQSDRTGRIISFFMRLVILIGRSIYFFVYVLFRMLLVIIWAAIPVLIVYRLAAIYVFPYAV